MSLNCQERCTLAFFFFFFISIQINFRFLCVVYVCSNHLDVFTPMPEVL